MSGSIVNAFKSAEQACYGFLLRTLEAQDGQTAFCPRRPKSFDYKNQRCLWAFRMGAESGAAPLDYEWNMGTPGGGDCPIEMIGASIEGFWKERDDAIHDYGLLRAALPIVEDSLAGVFRFRIRQVPSIVDAVYQREADLPQGNLIRGTGMTVPLEVWFHKAPAGGG